MIEGRLAKYEPIKSGEAKLSIYVQKAMMPEVLPLDGKEVVIMSKDYWESLPEIPDRNTSLMQIRDKCYQLAEMVEAELRSKKVSVAPLDYSGLNGIGEADGAEPLIAPAESLKEVQDGKD